MGTAINYDISEAMQINEAFLKKNVQSLSLNGVDFWCYQVSEIFELTF